MNVWYGLSDKTFITPCLIHHSSKKRLILKLPRNVRYSGKLNFRFIFVRIMMQGDKTDVSLLKWHDNYNISFKNHLFTFNFLSKYQFFKDQSNYHSLKVNDGKFFCKSRSFYKLLWCTRCTEWWLLFFIEQKKNVRQFIP